MEEFDSFSLFKRYPIQLQLDSNQFRVRHLEKVVARNLTIGEFKQNTLFCFFTLNIADSDDDFFFLRSSTFESYSALTWDIRPNQKSLLGQNLLASQVFQLILWRQIKEEKEIALIRWKIDLKYLKYLGNNKLRNIPNLVVLSLRGNLFIMPMEYQILEHKFYCLVNQNELVSSADVNSILRLQVYGRSISDTRNRLTDHCLYLDSMMHTLPHNSRFEESRKKIIQIKAKLKSSKKAFEIQIQTLAQKKQTLKTQEKMLSDLIYDKNEVILTLLKYRLSNDKNKHRRLCELIKWRRIVLMASLGDILNISKNSIAQLNLNGLDKNNWRVTSSFYGKIVQLMCTAASILHISYPHALNFCPSISFLTLQSNLGMFVHQSAENVYPLYLTGKKSAKFVQAVGYLSENIVHLRHCVGLSSGSDCIKNIVNLMEGYKYLAETKPDRNSNNDECSLYESDLDEDICLPQIRRSESCGNMERCVDFLQRSESVDYIDKF